MMVLQKNLVLQNYSIKKVILVGVPGAFTPTCTNEHLPGYIKHFDSFKLKGIDEIFLLPLMILL